MLCAAALGVLSAPHALAAPLRVYDQASVEATELVRTETGFQVRGQLRDSVGAAIPGLLVQTTDAPGEPCADLGPVSDPEGRFCIARKGRVPKTPLRLVTGASADYAAAEANVPLVRSRRRPRLTLELPTPALDLDGTPWRVGVQLDGLDATEDRYDVELAFTRQPQGPFITLGTGIISAREPAIFRIQPSLLGAPGTGTLRARVRVAEAPLEVTTAFQAIGTVSLDVSAPDLPAQPGGSLELVVRGQVNGLGVNAGGVRILGDEATLAEAPFASGLATAVFRVPTAPTGELRLRVQYVPGDAYHQASPDVALTVPLAAPGPLWLVWAASAAAACLWLLRQWWRPRRIVPPARDLPSVGARIDTGRRHADGEHASGLVLDEHTARPIPNATITLLVPGFPAERRTLLALSTEQGAFPAQPQGQSVEGSRWLVEAPGYASLVGPAPSSGSVRVYLVTHRRAALQLLSRWLLASGPPWNESATTPGVAARIARQHSRPDVETWANEIERVAYGTGVPTGEEQARLTNATPPLDRSGADRR